MNIIFYNRSPDKIEKNEIGFHRLVFFPHDSVEYANEYFEVGGKPQPHELMNMGGCYRYDPPDLYIIGRPIDETYKTMKEEEKIKDAGITKSIKKYAQKNMKGTNIIVWHPEEYRELLGYNAKDKRNFFSLSNDLFVPSDEQINDALIEKIKGFDRKK